MEDELFNKIPISHLGKVVGFIVELNGTNLRYYQSFRTKAHFMILFQGLGISVEVLEHLKMANVNDIRLIYTGTKGVIIYKSTLDQWFKSTKTWNDNGDEQKFLSTGEMEANINRSD